MRVPIAYYLMLLYATVMFKPLFPVMSDAVSHIFSEAIHIATVHAVYGSNHLQKELSNTETDNDHNKHQSSINSEDQVPVHVATNECLFRFSLNGTQINYSSFKLYSLKPGFIVKNSPPPKFSL